jgi:hypothetical protein
MVAGKTQTAADATDDGCVRPDHTGRRGDVRQTGGSSLRGPAEPGDVRRGEASAAPRAGRLVESDDRSEHHFP